jgi:hypothetical protein
MKKGESISIHQVPVSELLDRYCHARSPVTVSTIKWAVVGELRWALQLFLEAGWHRSEPRPRRPEIAELVFSCLIRVSTGAAEDRATETLVSWGKSVVTCSQAE